MLPIYSVLVGVLLLVGGFIGACAITNPTVALIPSIASGVGLLMIIFGGMFAAADA